MGTGTLGPGSARLHLLPGVALLRPEEQAFEAMLDGWRNQQLARRLAFPRWTRGCAWCARSPRTPTPSRGCGRRAWSMSG